MKKSRGFMARVLAIVLVFGMLFSGCSTTRHSVSISNVSNVKEVYIRNSGTSNWGTNLTGSLQNIDKLKFSEKVDIRVIDTNGITYSKYDVPFDDAAFEETGKERHMGKGSIILLSVLGAVGAASMITWSYLRKDK